MSLLTQLKKTTSNKSKRLGRGYGSGKGGHTSSRGQKGQHSRVGSKVPLWFEGGQLPLVKRLPMTRGKGKFKVVRPVAEVSLTELERLDVKEVNLESLKLNKVIERAFKQAKVINTGKLTKKIMVKGLRVSAQAKKIIEKLGGKVEP